MDEKTWEIIVRQARYMKRKPLTKKELGDLYDYAIAMEKLGIFNRDKWAGAGRKDAREN